MKPILDSDRTIRVEIPETVMNNIRGMGLRFQVNNLEDQDNELELVLYGPVGFHDFDGGFTASEVVALLSRNPDRPVVARINSPGGFAFDGIAVHNAFLSHPGGVTTIIEGMAASAASLIAMAGKPARIYRNAHMFVHRSIAVAMGNIDVMLDVAESLKRVDESIIRSMAARAGRPLRDMRHLVVGDHLEGTQLTAKEALEYGLVDEILDLEPSRERGNINQKDTAPVTPDARNRAIRDWYREYFRALSSMVTPEN